MSKGLKVLFLIHAAISLIFGLLLLVIPGRFLLALGWAPIDPIASRMLGAALLALAWGSFRGWQATERVQVAILIELETIFTVLVCVGLLRHLLFASWPLMVWLIFALFLAFAIAWIYFLVRKD
jgi:hypothetical protein